ncbi:MAG: alpha-glucan family phosphorylase [Chlorobi bacterium]|nr:alpha-glucan family phosphorylase [Chlorobiota bacterium]
MKPNALFEVSWEVCNKVGGIYTVLSTKVPSMVSRFGERFFLIGPDVVKDNGDHHEFIQDDQLYRLWKEQAISEGLEVRVGRWNIKGKPVVILIDFYHFINQKDEIFKRFWELYQLDSLSGQWDYIEPALFGYAAGRVIESFANFNLGTRDRIMAQFHEWMTGAGVLYLRDSAPHIATAFTTHATALGRAIAGNNRPLYREMEQYNPLQVAREFNIIAKLSLESKAARQADVFTTVSDITARECAHFLEKEVDVVTPNGFDDSFLPVADAFDGKRQKAREVMLKVAGALYNKEYPGDTFLMGISGRYEFHNKGIDLFIKTLKVFRDKEISRQVIAFILIPADHSGPRPELLKSLETNEHIDSDNHFITHGLHYFEHDAMVRMIKDLGLDQPRDGNPGIVLVPCYLNGDDGIFNLAYYDLLIGLDLTVFPSYYEPWGYTPLESLAFHVPTMTTTLAGFGLWVKEHFEIRHKGIVVLERTDDNDAEMIQQILVEIIHFLEMSSEDIFKAREEAFAIAQTAKWEKLAQYYMDAYNLALPKVSDRFGSMRLTQTGPTPFVPVKKRINNPQWKSLFVESRLPERLLPLEELALNIWWSWNEEAEQLWKSIDPELWAASGYNPVLLLKRTDYTKLLKLTQKKEFLDKMDRVLETFHAYLSEVPKQHEPLVAYFSMEFGLLETLKIYSGGLGILAGDYLKEASDENRKMVGIGLLYRYGYFKQLLSVNGDQQEVYEAEQFSDLPARLVKDDEGNLLRVKVAFPGRDVILRIWEVRVGKISLYLMDTDHEENQERDRRITYHLYGGDSENRLKQELVLGIGGVRALQALNIVPDIFHSNEGHSAFIGIERINKLIQEDHLSFAEAREVVRGTSLFTTHTPVPAGHDVFDEPLLRTYIAHYPERLKIAWDELMNLGRKATGDNPAKFNMSFLAANLSGGLNGVSKLHGDVSKVIFKDLWPAFLKEELHIGYVTNGVHYSTWASAYWKDYLKQTFGTGKKAVTPCMETWKRVKDIPDKDLWNIRHSAKKALFEHIRERYAKNGIRRFESPKKMMEISQNLREDILTIGFARRFATYKRGGLIFRDVERLKKIVTNVKRPVQFIFAGKAHPNDGGGKQLIRTIYAFSRDPEFQGRILFLENYDIELAKKMVQGVDIWLNTPTRPLEASGTSGEKAVMNGTLHFSILDGWWVEGYKPGTGWALPLEKTYKNQDYQDELDAEMIYNLLESEIIPLFYKRNKEGIPVEWLKFIRKNLMDVAPGFTMQRMMHDYYEKYYTPLFDRGKKLKKNHFRDARMLALWKYKMFTMIDDIEVISVDFETGSKQNYLIGEKYTGHVVLDLKELLPEWLTLELVVTDKNSEGETVLVHKQAFEIEKTEGNRVSYKIMITPTIPGYFYYSLRLVPTHPLLPGRKDINLSRWL